MELSTLNVLIGVISTISAGVLSWYIAIRSSRKETEAAILSAQAEFRNDLLERIHQQDEMGNDLNRRIDELRRDKDTMQLDYEKRIREVYNEIDQWRQNYSRLFDDYHKLKYDYSALKREFEVLRQTYETVLAKYEILKKDIDNKA